MTLTGYLKVYSHLMVTISTTRVMQRIMTLKKTTVFTQIQADEAFSLNSVIKYERLSLRTKQANVTTQKLSSGDLEANVPRWRQQTGLIKAKSVQKSFHRYKHCCSFFGPCK